jgi:hypothetical protein
MPARHLQRKWRNPGTQPVCYRPILETIEARLLPGETFGWFVLTSLDFVRDLLTPVMTASDAAPGPASPGAAWAVDPAGALKPSARPEELANSMLAGRWESRSTSGSILAPAATDQVFTTGALIPAFAAPPLPPGGVHGRLGGQSRLGPPDDPSPPVWSSYGNGPQHNAVAQVPSQPLEAIHWKTPVDLAPQYNNGELLIHYGSPLVTAANTVIVPVKTGATNGFQVEARDGATGTLKWSLATDYLLPPHHWTPSYSPTLTAQNRLYFAGVGGTIYFRDNVDSSVGGTGQLAFYGLANYDPSLDSKVYISTPITADANGTIYFGFTVTGSNILNLQSGLARIDTNGVGSWIAASTAAGDANISHVVYNNAPALSKDGSTLYVAVSTNNATGYLLALDSTTLAPLAKVALKDPESGADATLDDDGTASPTVAPDGDVYFGVLENPFPENHDRGWLLHFHSDLSIPPGAVPGAFGWDDTVSIVDASLVPSYTGPSSYLLMTKYNNYAGWNGDGVNKIAIIDPNTAMIDPITGIEVMNEVLTAAGQTPDPEFPNKPGAVREWCINNAAVDPFTDSILANSEDGQVYRWDLTTNTFTEVVKLTQATGEAYTPTVVGADGTVYAINNATLFAVGTG